MSAPPSKDNMINVHGVNMSNALNQIMSIQEQSYDEFLNGFTYLNKEECWKSATGQKSESNAVSKKGSDLSPEVINGQSMDTFRSEAGQTIRDISETDNGQDKAATPHLEDELEEEVLGEGEKSGVMLQTSAPGITSKLQFDNFVSSEGDSDVEDLPTENVEEDDINFGSYQASFVKTTKRMCHSEDSQTKKDVDNSCQPSVVKNTTEACDSEVRINPDPSCLDKGDCYFDDANVNDILDVSSNCSNLSDCQKSSTHSTDAHDDCEERSHHLTVTDNVGLPPCDSTLNPGEVEDPGSPMVVNRTHRTLDFSASYKTDILQEESNQECSNEVTSFTLDEDFDYDNVVLTPKFSSSELQYLKSFCKT